MVAIIETGGKQYCIQPGQKITVEYIKKNVGETITFSNILGSNSITAKVVEQIRTPKVITRKFRNKTRYHRLYGFRKPMTVITINEKEKDTPKPTTKAKAKVKSEDSTDA